MKKVITLAFSFILLVVLCGCGTYKLISQPEPRYFLPDQALQKINAAQPVAVKNVSTSIARAEDVLCGFGSWRVIGSLYDFTESVVSITKDALKRKNVAINDKAQKMLELYISRAACDKSWSSFSAGLTLQVKTGNGLVKDYQTTEKYAFGYSTTNTFEVIMPRLVEQMLNDKDILEYLK
jgi:hypothetical protein